MSGYQPKTEVETRPNQQQACPSCAAEGPEVFYTADGIPAHSCLLFEKEREAIEYPRLDLRLGFCRACGFIYNTIFDPAGVGYGCGYEDTQTFSGHFRGYLESLAQRIIERYNLYGKDIVEIGCGKGDFLLLLCELGNNRGVGLDPSFDPQRITKQTGANVEFIRDFYSEKYSHLPADFICCRHTLEHICAVGEFLGTVRKAIGVRKNTVVLFDLPSALRILAEGAFWDVYYEHCSYFSPGSLARLFRRSGFDLLQLELDYDEQYVLIAGRASEAGPVESVRFDLENDLEDLRAGVDGFAKNCPRHIEAWRKVLAERLAAGQKTAIWGSGSKCVSFLSAVGPDDGIETVVDINPYRHGKYIPGTGKQILPPSALREHRPELVIVMNPVYEAEIRAELQRMGIDAEVATVLRY